jgi:hypothetical protein
MRLLIVVQNQRGSMVSSDEGWRAVHTNRNKMNIQRPSFEEFSLKPASIFEK